MPEQIVDISQAQRKSPLPSGRERELETQLLTRDTALNTRVRELEGARR